MLITAGNEEAYDDCKLGVAWRYYGGMNVATACPNPQRYTKEFVDAEDMYTLSFFKRRVQKSIEPVWYKIRDVTVIKIKRQD